MTTIDAYMSLITDLLAKGYFPAELPPCFSSLNFPLAFGSSSPVPPAFQNPPNSRGTPFSFARGGTGAIRRNLTILNPIGFYALAESVAANWAAIDGHIGLMNISRSRPRHWPGAQRALSTSSYSKRYLVQPKARLRATARAIVLADLSQFYHSIYTHSIPWAFHTKTVAKANHSPSLFGNRIDSLVQRCQDRQTRGIPIGPDTSLVIAESILSAVEQAVVARVPGFQGIRFIDDYELCFGDYGAAEHALSILQEELQRFELQLNPLKTKIVTPPIRFEPIWIGDFRTFVIRTNSGQHGDLVRYFDLITSYNAGNADDHVAKYAISKLLLNAFLPLVANTGLYQALLCQLLMSQPSAVKEIVSALVALHTASPSLIDGALIGTSFSEVIARAAPLGHHYEISWVLYGSMRMSIALHPHAISGLSNCDNAVVALMSLNANALGLLPGLNLSLWSAHMTGPDLQDEFWILTYEANRLGWLPWVSGIDPIPNDQGFSHLRTQQIRFYNPL